MNFFRLFFAYLFPIIFSAKPFLVKVSGVKLFLPPHSLDVLIPAETFLDKNYKPLFKLSKKPKVVIDLGTHVGDFTIWANNTFHPKKIVGVEMEKSIFQLYERNLELNNCGQNVIAINKAVHLISHKQINVQKIPILTAASLEISGSKGHTIETISLEEIIKLSDNQIIDYLKIDIEGAEKYLLTDKYRSFFQNRVRFVALECHRFIGVWPKEAENYFQELGYKTKFQKITALNFLNKLLHAQNQRL